MDEARNERITALYQREARNLQRAVARRVRDADPALVEDACAFAWAQLVRRTDMDPDRPATVAWLARVATHEGWAQASGQTASRFEETTEPAMAQRVEDLAEAHELAAMLDRLPERQRRVTMLQALGLKREEIAEITGDTLRTVDRQLTRARKALRKLRSEE